MAKKTRESLMQREKNRRGDGTISKVQLFSCYGASALIVILCIVEALKPETQASGNPAVYYLLAVLGVVFSVIITVRDRNARKSAQPKGKRLN